MKLTNFRFFKNTPLIDFQNTIHFGSEGRAIPAVITFEITMIKEVSGE